MFSLHSDKDKLYATVFRRFLSSALEYDVSLEEIRSRQVPQEVLLRVTPEHIIKYFKQCAFENYKDGDDLKDGMKFNIKLRANTLYYWKKCISHFMLMQNSGWDEVYCRGNPTKSKLVNSFIKDLVKFECKDLGVKSKARRAMEFREFLTLLKLIRKKGFVAGGQSMRDQLKWVRMAAFLSLQWQMIARMDDMMHLKFTNLCANHDFPFCLKCTIRWSKNTNEERSCPNQMLCPSNDPLLCPLLNLGIYLEQYAHDETVTQDSPIFGGDASRYTIGRLFESLLSDDEFLQVAGSLGGRLGNHSIRKGACTYAIRAGLLREYAISKIYFCTEHIDTHARMISVNILHRSKYVRNV